MSAKTGSHVSIFMAEAKADPLALLSSSWVAPENTPVAVKQRRRKVWELPTRWHCPLVGTCLTVGEMRKFARQIGYRETELSDYAIHTTLVQACSENRDFGKRLQRHLDQRFRVMLIRFDKARNESEILDLWRDALRTGEVSSALWAAWTHPELVDEMSGKVIYGDVHMLSHQMGASARAELLRLEQLKKENARLRDEVSALQHGLVEAERVRERLRADMEKRLAEAHSRAAMLPLREIELNEARRQARNYAALSERAEGLACRVDTLEERNATNANRARSLELALGEAHAELSAAEAALEAALAHCEGRSGVRGCGRSCPVAAGLNGRCVLCIGGRTGAVDGYRRLVEAAGGRFLHHDGGQEESLNRIDRIVSSADAVVCQSGCISHSAYWRLKEACKKLGKPCVFVQSQGLTSFARGLVVLAGAKDASFPITIARLSS